MQIRSTALSKQQAPWPRAPSLHPLCWALEHEIQGLGGRLSSPPGTGGRPGCPPPEGWRWLTAAVAPGCALCRRVSDGSGAASGESRGRWSRMHRPQACEGILRQAVWVPILSGRRAGPHFGTVHGTGVRGWLGDEGRAHLERVPDPQATRSLIDTFSTTQ